MRHFIYYLLIFALCSLFYSCALFSKESESEQTITLSLPQWPPQDPLARSYPALSRWRIVFTSAQSQKIWYSTDTAISVPCKKNRPFCVTAQPLTLLDDSGSSGDTNDTGSECAYFKPAGYLYTNPASSLTWEEGYLASVMQKLFYQTADNGLSPLESEYLISTFNWTKAQETIRKKLKESKAYNPWLIPDSQLLEGIYTQSFKSSLLNLTGCLTLENPAPDKFPILLSSFIPENNQAENSEIFSNFQKNQFTVRKNSPIIIGDGKKFALYITAKSAKNISLEVIYLPIFIEDL